CITVGDFSICSKPHWEAGKGVIATTANLSLAPERLCASLLVFALEGVIDQRGQGIDFSFF
ncbi:MAG TPA: hypothetical protein VFX94_00420, partial [Burkholderiales bacterium]|nr:hypothetical protein [Burkholderiales bacterium]